MQLCYKEIQTLLQFLRHQPLQYKGLGPKTTVVILSILQADRTWVYTVCSDRSLVGLEFNGLVNTIKVMSSRTDYLTRLYLGRLSPLWLTSTGAHSFVRNWQLPFLNQLRRENDRRKYFMMNLNKRMLPDPAGIEPVTLWSPAGGLSDWAIGPGSGLSVWMLRVNMVYRNPG